MNLKVALPNGRYIIAKGEPSKDLIGYRVLISKEDKGTTGIVVGLSDKPYDVEEFTVPDRYPVITRAHVSALVDTARIYGLSPWHLLFQLLPSEFHWSTERYIRRSARVKTSLDAKSLRVINFVEGKGKVKEELLKKRFGKELVEFLKARGFLEEFIEWDMPRLEVKIYSLNVGVEEAFHRLKGSKKKEDRMRLVAYIAERLYATREEILQAGFKSEDLRFLLKKGIIKEGVEYAYGITHMPKILRQTTPELIRKVGDKGVIWGSREKLIARLLELIEDSVASGKGSLVFFSHISDLSSLENTLRDCFGDRVLFFSSRLNSKDLVRNWFLAYEGNYTLVGTRLVALAPITNVDKVIIFDDKYTKLQNGVDLKVFFYLLSRYASAKFIVLTPCMDTYTYKAVVDGLFSEEFLPSDAKVSVVERKPTEILSNYTLKLLKNPQENTLILVNKVGYSYAYCPSCRELLLCPKCSSILTLDKEKSMAFCGRCGYRMLAVCPTHEIGLQEWGFGIDRVLEEVYKTVENTQNLHFDTFPTLTRSYDKVIVVNADNILSVPFFDSQEMYFCYLWRAMSVCKKELVIQTLYPKSPIIESLLNKKPYSFLEVELEERKQERLPPFVKVVVAQYAYLKDKNVEPLNRLCEYMKVFKKGERWEVFCKTSNNNLGDVLKALRREKPINISVF